VNDDDLWKRIQRAAKAGPDMRKPQYPGGYEPPAKGPARARLVGYFEMGTHEEEYEGQKRDRSKVDLVFELSGPNHEPRKLDSGELVPIRVTVQETLSLDPDKSFFGLFSAMNYAGKATHMAELLGEAFIVEVFHKRSRDRTRVYANLKGPNGYNITAPTVKDEITGKAKAIQVAPAITKLLLFSWANADKDDWDSIYIPGEYAERRDDQTGEIVSPAHSKNVIQEKIKKGRNWPAHPLAAIVD
jgi:hypothetical protein